MENKKLTKVQKFEMLKEYVLDNSELVEFIDHEIELLQNKKGRSSETKTQKENVAIMDKMVEVLTDLNRPVTITEFQNANEEMGMYSNQKLSALFKKLVEDNRVIKTSDKKKSYFSIV